MRNASPSALKITSVSAKDARITVSPTGARPLPVVLAPSGTAEFTATIDLASPAGTVLRDEIAITTDNAHTPRLPLPIYIRFGPPPRPVTPRTWPAPGTPPSPAPFPAAR